MYRYTFILATILFSCFAGPARVQATETQTLLLSCSSLLPEEGPILDVYYDNEWGYFLIERLPFPPYEQEAHLAQAPLATGDSTLFLKENGPEGHAYVYPVSGSSDWYIDIQLGTIQISEPRG